MKHILVLLTFSFFCYSVHAQTITGTFVGDRVKNFRLSHDYICVDGFGSKKTILVEKSSKDKFGLKFKSEYYMYWLTVEDSTIYLNIGWNKCKYCKPYKFQVKKFKKVDLR